LKRFAGKFAIKIRCIVVTRLKDTD